MAVHSREELKQYCLRALGAPVLEINVDDEQLEDRIDEAVDYWTQYHSDGTEKIYMKQLITASRINLTSAVSSQFSVGENITGSISQATAVVTFEGKTVSTGSTLLVYKVTGNFVAGETITGDKSMSSAILAVNPVVKGNFDNQYIDVPELVVGITNVFQLSISQSFSSNSVFSLQYQMRLNDMHDLSSISMIYYTTAMSYLDLLNFELNRSVQIRYNKLQGKLFLDINWISDVHIGQYVIVECYRALDPVLYSKMWGELWLKHYTTALFKRMWATNLKKFGGMLLPGGVTIDGQGLYDESVGEIKDLEDELMNKSAPLSWFLG